MRVGNPGPRGRQATTSAAGNPGGAPLFPHPSFPAPHPSFLRRQESILPPRPPSRRGNPCGCPFPAPTRFHPLRARKATRHSCGGRSHAPCPLNPSPSFPLRAPSVIPAPHPSFLRRQESILPPRPPPVGATLVVARSRRQPVFIPICGLTRPPVIPAESLPRAPTRGRNPSSLPVPRPVGATLVVARSRRQPVSIPLMWPSQGHPSFLRRQESIPSAPSAVNPSPPPGNATKCNTMQHFRPCFTSHIPTW